MNKKGFTLIEMLVVIAIIAVLVAIIVPTVTNSTMKAKGAADAANIRSLTAQAAIDAMSESGSTVLTTGKTFTSKVYGAATIKWTESSGALVAEITAGEKTLTLQDFVDIAETGAKK